MLTQKLSFRETNKIKDKEGEMHASFMQQSKQHLSL